MMPLIVWTAMLCQPGSVFACHRPHIYQTFYTRELCEMALPFALDQEPRGSVAYCVATKP